MSPETIPSPQPDARILAIESSCDETAAAVVENGRLILSSVVASQVDLHAQFGGVFPEVASRQHIRTIYTIVEEALRQAYLDLGNVDALAYTRTSDGRALRAMPRQAERTELIERFYHPHHAQLRKAVSTSLDYWQPCLVIDCHSFPSSPLPYERDQSFDRPDICIGTDSFHTSEWLRDGARHLFETSGFQVAIDRPYAGALVPASYYRRTERVLAFMVEVNRSLYMEEVSRQRHSDFEIQAERIRAVLLSLIEEFRKRVLAGPKAG